MTTELDVRFGDARGRPLLLDLMRPAGPGPFGAVVWLHGGGWYSGDKRNVLTTHMLDLLPDNGLLVASVGYRLAGEATFPAQIHDVKAAIRWLRARAGELGVDPERIAVAGMSAGGHLAALAGATGDLPELEGACGSPGHSSRVAAVVALAAPTDFLRNPWASDPRFNPYSRGGRTPEEILLGGPLADRLDLARLANPVAHVRATCPPFLIVHGCMDEIVPADQAEILHAALAASGVPATLLLVRDGNHGFWRSGEPYPSDPMPSGLRRWILRFLQAHVGSGAPFAPPGRRVLTVDGLL